jgi:general secretion pathway protein G
MDKSEVTGAIMRQPARKMQMNVHMPPLRNPEISLGTPLRQIKDAGFSLLELMVVVVILSILALVIVPRVIDRPDQARAARAQSNIAAVASALELYRLDNLRYPTTEQGLAALVTRPATDPAPKNYATNGYIDRMPRDPWGVPYQYLSPGLHG